MNIISTSGRDSDHLHAEIDQDATRVLAAFSKGLNSLHRRLASTRDEIILEDILFASRFCAHLGSHPNGNLEIPVADARRTFAITMRVCEVHREVIGHSHGLAVVLQLLACITPVFIPRSQLPAAVEIFEKERDEDEDVMAYEHVRLWREPGDPQLPMLLASHLWKVLRRHDRLPKCVRAFVESLEGITAAFRETVASLHKGAIDEFDRQSDGRRK